MALQIRRAALDHDRAELISLFKRSLTPHFDEQRFTWLYCDGPHGAARAWVACDGARGAVVGAAAVFPRKMYFDGQPKLGYVLGDFCVDNGYRSLGPALLLQRACLDEATRPCVEFCYDFPSLSMMAVYQRLKVEPAGVLLRWAKPLRAEHKFESTIPSKALAKGLGTVANAVLARRGWKGAEGACELIVHGQRCGMEFTALDSQLCGQPGIKTVRSSEYLNWRYLDHPGMRYEILTARRAGALIAYAVFAQESQYASIADLCSVEEPAVIGRLLAGVVELLRLRGVLTVSLNSGESHPWNRLFERAGFWKRERAPVIVYAQKKLSRAESGLLWNWYLMQGERDS